MISTNMISNCPINIKDVDNAEKIFGRSMASLKGKSTRSKPKPVIRDDIQIPEEIYNKNSNLDLCIDVIYINRVAFLVSIDKQIKYRSIIHVKDQDTPEFFKSLDQILRLYNLAGFTITTIHADN